jgi:hypothetical protein
MENIKEYFATKDVVYDREDKVIRANGKIFCSIANLHHQDAFGEFLKNLIIDSCSGVVDSAANKEEIKEVCLYNAIKTPDGTVLVSRYTHDFVCHEDVVTGTRYCLDGGTGWYRRILPGGPYLDLAVYSSDPFEKIREVLERGNRGKDGDQPLEWVKLKDMSDEWLKALIIWIEENQPDNQYKPYYIKEIEYRKENQITISE